MVSAQPSPVFAAACYFGGAALIGVLTWIGYSFPAEVWWPYPITLVISAWTIGASVLGNIDDGPRLIPLLGVLPFLLVGIPLLVPRSRAVWPALGFASFVIAGSALYFAFSWSYGVKYQGLTATVVLAVANAILACLSMFICARAIKTRTFWHRYLVAFVPCPWFAWCAFPWLGEMP
jgi:hypothetical protein